MGDPGDAEGRLEVVFDKPRTVVGDYTGLLTRVFLQDPRKIGSTLSSFIAKRISPHSRVSATADQHGAEEVVDGAGQVELRYVDVALIMAFGGLNKAPALFR